MRALDLKGLAIGAARFDFAGQTETRRSSICRSNCATKSAASRSTANIRPAPCRCSTSAGGGARIGLVSGEAADVSQPLLAPNYYLKKALAPFADVREARPGTTDPMHELLEGHVAIMILADVGAVHGSGA